MADYTTRTPPRSSSGWIIFAVLVALAILFLAFIGGPGPETTDTLTTNPDAVAPAATAVPEGAPAPVAPATTPPVVDGN